MNTIPQWRLEGDWFDVCKCGAEVGPGQIATWGVATADRADAMGWSFDWAGRSSKHFPFDWSGP